MLCQIVSQPWNRRLLVLCLTSDGCLMVRESSRKMGHAIVYEFTAYRLYLCQLPFEVYERGKV